MRVLYAGDSLAGGPANYLLGILRRMRADVYHLPPSKILSPRYLKRRYDAILLSDFPARNVPKASQEEMVRQVEEGTGLAMIGGWASFSGPFGQWRGTLIENILPITCLNRDDRVNFPGGAFIAAKKKHPMFRGLSFKNPPVLCGLNEFIPRKGSEVLLSAKRVLTSPLTPTSTKQRSGPAALYGGLSLLGRGRGEGKHALRLRLDSREHPLLVIDSNPNNRVAALATDLAPHWCGGMVDWGTKQLKLLVTKGISIEAGNRYVEFVSSLIRWLGGLRN